MDTTAFRRDLELIPEHLDALAGHLEGMVRAPALGAGTPGGGERVPGRVLVLGMGSSAYAASRVTALARRLGAAATTELASFATPVPPAEDLTVVAVSATGRSVEVLAAVEPYAGTGRLVAVTNDDASPLAALADRVVLLHAGTERSGVSARTYRHTLAVLPALLAPWAPGLADGLPDAVRRAAAASSSLLEREGQWAEALADHLLGPDGTYLLAPAERLCSAQQGALMLREVPRRPAVACEVGDWSHVDVYLTRTLDYRALLYAGSRWQEQALEWMARRRTPFAVVGGDVAGASVAVRFPDDDDATVAALTEPLVADLVAERWRVADPDLSWAHVDVPL